MKNIQDMMQKAQAGKQAVPTLAAALLPQVATWFLYALGACVLVALLLGVMCLPVTLFWFCWNNFFHAVLGLGHATFTQAIAGTLSLLIVCGIIYGLKEA